jgi:hypothetical protein
MKKGHEASIEKAKTLKEIIEYAETLIDGEGKTALLMHLDIELSGLTDDAVSSIVLMLNKDKWIEWLDYDANRVQFLKWKAESN